jgi:hypothetical protein
MKEIKKLIDLKSIITLSLTIAFVYGFIAGKIEAKDFLIYIAMVYTYYFNKKENKEEDKAE